MIKLLRVAKNVIKFILAFTIIAGLLLIALSYVRQRPQDLPWTELSLDEPIGMFTNRKIAKLAGDYDKCQVLLDDADIMYTPFPANGQDRCRRDNNIILQKSALSYQPSVLAPSCTVTAALVLWEKQIVQPAAQRYFGQSVKSIQHYGVYSCRKIAGGSSWSEHATGNAIDIAAFTLMDDSKITVAGDWKGEATKAAFLRTVRDGSCDLFATILSPDYNAAHADHFHMDQASRGLARYGVCR